MVDDETQPIQAHPAQPDEEEESGSPDWMELWRRAERSKRQSRHALVFSVVAVMLFLAMAAAGIVYMIQQHQLQVAQRRSDCRSVLIAEYDAANSELFSAASNRPPDQDRIYRASAQLIRISQLRRDENPCEAARQFTPLPIGPAPIPDPPTTTTTTLVPSPAGPQQRSVGPSPTIGISPPPATVKPGNRKGHNR